MNASAKKKENYAEKPHILIVDDDARIRELVMRYLVEHEFVVLAAKDAAEARHMLGHFDVDAMIVDVMMPGETGLVFLHTLREAGNNVPAIMLTALGEAEDRIHGFEAGADDYLPKPFEPRELVLRLHAILKRGMQARVKLYCKIVIGPWVFDREQNLLVGDRGDIVKLTSMEVNLIKALAEHAGEAVSRDDLAKACGVDAGERTIDVQVTRLRRKIEEDTKLPRYLQTVRGQGYLLRADIR